MIPAVRASERDGIGARGHHLFGILGSEVHDAFQNALFVFRPIRVVGEFERLLQVLHTDSRGGCCESVVHPPAHAHERPPHRAQGPLRPRQRLGHEFGELHPVGRGVDFWDHFSKQHQQKGDTGHVNQSACPRGEGFAWEKVFGNHGGDEHDGDVHQVVHHQNGAQQVSWALRVVGRAHQGEDALGGGRILAFEVVKGLGRKAEKRHFRT